MQLLFILIVGAMSIFRQRMNSHYQNDVAADAAMEEQDNDDNSQQQQQQQQQQETIDSTNETTRSTIRKSSSPPPPPSFSEIEEFAVMPGLFPLRCLSWTESWTEECQAVKSAAQGISDMAYKTLRKGASFLLPATRPKGNGSTEVLKHPDEMPPDVQVNILSFLHPKDIVTFAATSKACREIVDGDGPTTVALWKTLWERDYGWIIHSWEVGRQAYRRSIHYSFNADDLDPVFRKDFYFRFGLSYINYILAGLNTQDKCMVGLHGNIYDMTDFVLKHPGSPDTLLVHAGRDSTQFFDDMDHSRYARRVAKNFCVAVDMAYQYNGSYGLKPTAAFEADRPNATPALVEPEFVIGKRIRKPRRRNCLERVYIDFHSEQRQHRKDFKAKMKTNSNVLHSNIFYDPFRRVWTGWYTSTDFKTVFAS